MKTPHPAFDPDALPTAEEQAQAEALAQALEQGASPPLPAELAEPLETAALLRQSAGAPLPARVLAEVLPALPARRPRRRRWLWPALAIPATAALLVVAAASVTWRNPRMAATSATPTAAVPVSAPRPPLPLLQAQAEAAHGDSKALATLDAEMRRYRATFYGSQGRR
jgi:hypothetical protein